MAGIGKLIECLYSAESSLAENAESAASNTWTNKVAINGYDLSTSQDRIRDGALVSRMNDEGLSHLGPRDAALSLTTYLPGHFTTTAGSLTPTWVHDLISDGLGGSKTNFAGTTVSSASSASSITPAVTTNLAAGEIICVGSKGDGGGDGQAAVVNSPGSPTTLLTALPAEPADNAVIYATQTSYPDESTAHTLGTKRFMAGWTSSPTAGQQYHLMGGQLATLGFSFPLATNELPTVSLGYRFAYWQRAAMTIPHTSLSRESNFAAPCAGGSVFYQSFGTATRGTLTPASVDLTIDLGLEPIYGPGGAGIYQQIVGWVRTGSKPTLTMVVPWDSAYETLFDTANQSYTYKHILFTSNAIDGRRVGFYMPRCMIVGNRPSQPTIINGQTYVTVQFVGVESTTTTSELTRSAWRLFMG